MNFTPEQQAYIDDTTARMKAEIVEDMTTGRIGPDTFSFAGLHDFVDANEYGGLCEESEGGTLRGLDLAESLFPETESEDGENGWTRVTEKMQTAVGEWLASRRHLHELPPYRAEFPRFGVLDVVVPEGWIDESWHDEACPSFTRGRLRIWIDFANPEDREAGGLTRFCLMREDGPGAGTTELDRMLCSTNDWAEVLEEIQANEALALEDLEVLYGEKGQGVKLKYTVSEQFPDFTGFLHDHMWIMNPTVSPGGSFRVSPARYGFEVASTGGPASAWCKGLADGTQLLLTHYDGMTHELGAPGTECAIGHYDAEGSEIRTYVAVVGEPFKHAPGGAPAEAEVHHPEQAPGAWPFVIGEPKGTALPERFTMQRMSDGRAMLLQDRETGRSVSVPVYAYGPVRDALGALFGPAADAERHDEGEGESPRPRA